MGCLAWSRAGRLLLGLVLGSGVACSVGVEHAYDEASNEQPGTAILKLEPVAGVTIDTLSYVVTRDGVVAPVRQGILPARGGGVTLHVALELPAGAGYTLSMSGYSEEQGKEFICTGAVGPFNVGAGGNVPLDLAFTCFDVSLGEATNGVTIKTDACPAIRFGPVTALPGEAFVSESIAVGVLVNELEGRPLSYLWQADPAIVTVENPTSPTASITCLSPVATALLKVTAFNGQCSKAVTTRFGCLAKP